MEKILLRILFASSLAAAPFILKRNNLLMYLTVFFTKCVLSSSIDSFFIKKGHISYPVRPLSKVFDTNILYDFLFYPLLSVIWIRYSYQSKPRELITRSLFFSVPMTLLQWFLERKTDLFRWKSWSVLHTFASLNFTLFTIRGFVGLLKRITPEINVRERNFVEERPHSKMPSPEFIASSANYRLPNDNYAQIQ
ncbi:CBO0543 family protein [Paenibacillus sp. Soil787]|uniref:CBO0543 family protein n=1 Tax=Paenibacillus sp. Soil787 TaxID=1736411 RepID=UPI0007C68593|nr:CBO0543 family protein [Paenibacillus sp. Soil787]